MKEAGGRVSFLHRLQAEPFQPLWLRKGKKTRDRVGSFGARNEEKNNAVVLEQYLKMLGAEQKATSPTGH